MRNNILLPTCLLASLLSGMPCGIADDAAETIFVRRIAPLLRDKCLGCHGNDPDKLEGHLDLRTPEVTLHGGDSGSPSVVPGNPDESPLYLAVTREGDPWSAMPPKEAEALTPEQLGWIREWITGGASWPNSERMSEIAEANAQAWSAEDGITVKSSGGLSPEWTDRKYKPDGLWAYQPVRTPPLPAEAENAIDAFVAARTPPGLSVAPRVDAAAFIRRATFDLTGLPPIGTSYAVFQPRRLSAEELRDAMLLVTGELNPALGGIPNRPEINLEAAMQPRQVMGTFAAAWTPNPLPQQRHRRSIYALKLRGLADPFLEVFNAPAPDFSCERREASTVTPQVFSLFNGQNVHSRALALANRVLTELNETEQGDATVGLSRDEMAIERCFELVLARIPNDEERRICLVHWREIEAGLSEQVAATPKPPLEIRRDAIEENTGEKFSFSEQLHAHTEFVADLQPADVSRHTRALADICLILLNSNEFVYVY